VTARRIAPALLALAVFAGVAEWAVGRWLMAPRNDVVPTPYGRLFRPGARYVQSAEGWGVFTANRHGFLDDDVDTTGAKRVAVLFGDSFGQGLQVRDEERFSEVAETLVPGLEILNAAGAGRNPYHYALFAPRFRAAFEPEWLIVQLNDADLSDMEDARVTAEALAEFEATRDALPAAVAPAPARSGLRRLARRSALVTFLDSRIGRLSQRERERLGQKLRGVKPDLRDVVALPATPRAEALLDSLVGEIARVHRRVVLVYVPHIHYFHSPPVPAYPARRAWFHTLATRHGLPLVDPTDEMLEDYRRTREPLHGFANTQPAAGHLNARGHRVLGECLARELRRESGSVLAEGPSAAGGVARR
jgi:hypothetical protein